MVRCSVLNCKSDSEKKLPELSFHSFPENENIRKKWIDATGRTNWLPKKSSKICSRHFMPNVLIKKKKLTVLLPNAMPILETDINMESTNLNQPMETDSDPTLRLGTQVECVKLIAVPGPSNPGPDTSLKTAKNSDDDAQMDIEHQQIIVVEKTKSPNYTPRTMKRKLKRTQQQSAERLKRLKAAREKCRRLTKKVADFSNIIAELKAKFIISEEDGCLLESIDPVNKDVLKKYLSPQTSGRKFSPALRKFALC